MVNVSVIKGLCEYAKENLLRFNFIRIDYFLTVYQLSYACFIRTSMFKLWETINNCLFNIRILEAYSQPCQTSRWIFLLSAVSSFCKSSILDVWHGSEYTCGGSEYTCGATFKVSKVYCSSRSFKIFNVFVI